MPVNCTDVLSCYNYNMTSLFGDNTGDTIITDSVSWLGSFNSLMDGLYFIGVVLLLGIVLYFLMKKTGQDDANSIVYSGLIITVTSIILFLANTGGDKLITFPQLSIVVILTVLMAGVSKMVKPY